MAALTDARDPREIPDTRTLPPIPVAASTTIYAGALVLINAAGFAVPAAAGTAGKVYGVAFETVDNSAGANGDKTLSYVRQGVFHFDNHGADAIDAGDTMTVVYCQDDQTVKATQAASEPAAGICLGIDSQSSKVKVWIGALTAAALA